MAGIKGTTLTVISPPDILKLKLDSAASRLRKNPSFDVGAQ
jgi:hypothetical protein